MTTQEALELAARHYQAARLREAESLLRQILAREPDNPCALHVLGLIAHQSSHVDAAIVLLRRACDLQPSSIAMHCDLGVALAAPGHNQEELDQDAQAPERDPGHATTPNNPRNAFPPTGH